MQITVVIVIVIVRGHFFVKHPVGVDMHLLDL